MLYVQAVRKPNMFIVCLEMFGNLNLIAFYNECISHLPYIHALQFVPSIRPPLLLLLIELYISQRDFLIHQCCSSLRVSVCLHGLSVYASVLTKLLSPSAHFHFVYKHHGMVCMCPEYQVVQEVLIRKHSSLKIVTF